MAERGWPSRSASPCEDTHPQCSIRACCGWASRARAPARALTWRGESPRQAEVSPACDRRLLRRGTRGGELPEVNCQSVTKHHRKDEANVNSIRPDGGTSLRALSEVRPVAHASRIGKSLAAAGGAGQRDNERVLRETVSERKAATSPSGGWRQNGRKRKRVSRETCWGQTVFMAQGPKNRPAGVRASVVARKRLTSVEPRDAGKWKDEGQNTGRQTNASARKG